MDAPENSLSTQTITLAQGVARVHVAGAGSPLLLVHGGWSGASFHWQRVVAALAQRHRVVVPELPGLGALEQEPLSSVADYAHWLVLLMDALGIDRAACVGNSFGASVVWALAGRYPQRVSALILVNGFAMPATPPPLRVLGKHRNAQRLLRLIVRRIAYTPRALPRAFAHLWRAPSTIEVVVEEQWPRILPNYVRLLIAGDGSPRPQVPLLLLWGANDRLIGTDRRSAERLHASLPGAALTWIEDAGHFPQVEQPAAFVSALEAFLAAQAA